MQGWGHFVLFTLSLDSYRPGRIPQAHPNTRKPGQNAPPCRLHVVVFSLFLSWLVTDLGIILSSSKAPNNEVLIGVHILFVFFIFSAKLNVNRIYENTYARTVGNLIKNSKAHIPNTKMKQIKNFKRIYSKYKNETKTSNISNLNGLSYQVKQPSV